MFILVEDVAEGYMMKNIPDILNWLEDHRRNNCMTVRRIPFSASQEWSFSSGQETLEHHTGRFFTIEGLSVESLDSSVDGICQPIINQSEIGILGFLVQKRKDEYFFLVQAKNEPGNITQHQIAPTLQATESNFGCVHKGLKPAFLDYFIDVPDDKIIYNKLQSEQGSRFLKKRNRNIVVQEEGEIPLTDNGPFRWVSYTELFHLMGMDNIVNADARSVLACFPYHLLKAAKLNDNRFQNMLVNSIRYNKKDGLSDIEDIHHWLNNLKKEQFSTVKKMPLSALKGWEITDSEIANHSDNEFTVFNIDVRAPDREVHHWDQPILSSNDPGILCLFCKNINNILHFLIQAKAEPGTYNILELTTSIQSSEKDLKNDPALSGLAAKFHNAKPEQILYSAVQSEEGGRFYQDENKYFLIHYEEDEWEISENFTWLTLGQLKLLMQRSNFLTNELRSFIAQITPPPLPD